MKIYKLVLAAFLAASTCQAQNLVDLQQSALGNRKVVERYRLNVEKSQQDIAITKSGFYPSADVSYTINKLDESSLFEDSENSVLAGAVTYNIFNGFRDKYGLRAAGLQNKVESYRLDVVKQDLKRNVALRYLTIFSSKSALQVAKDSLETLQKVYDDAANRFKAGMIRKNELLKFQVDLDNAIITVKKSEVALRKSVLLLQREISQQIKMEDLSFSDLNGLPQVAALEQLQQELLQKRTDLKVLGELINVTEARVGMESAANYPMINLTVSYSTYDDNFVTGSGDVQEDEVRGQLMLSKNLFDGFAKTSRIGKAKLEARAIRYDLEELKQDLTTQLHNLYLDFQVSLENIEVAQRSIAQAEENLRVTRLGYEEGLERQSDLLDAIANLSRAKYNYVGAKSELYSNYYQINRAVESF